MKILIIANNTFDSCSFYRAGGISPDLSRQTGWTIDVASWQGSHFHWQSLMKYDVVMMLRPMSEAALTMAKYLKKLNIPLWVDHDDLLIGIPPENRMFSTMNEASKKTFAEIIAIADVVSVTTKELKVRLDSLNDNIHVIPNAHNDGLFGYERSKTKRNNLVLWRGSETHIADIHRWSHSIMLLVGDFREYAFVFAGFRPWYIQAINVEAMDPTDPLVFYENMKKLAPICLHVPLIDSPFNRCKSNIAWMEATYFGAAAIVPDWEEWQKPGTTTYSDDAGYYEAISRILKKEVNTERLVDQSWEYICDNLLLSKVNVKRINLINSLK